MTSKRSFAVVAGGLALVAVWGCRGAPSDGTAAGEPRDVLLITIDTLRADATGFSGASKASTPWMDRLAAGGFVATGAHAHSVMTLPSHATILTGLHPYEHGIRDNAGFRLSGHHPTLATLLAGAGYRTAAFVSAFPLDRRFGLDRGFDHYDDGYQGGGVVTFPERVGEQTVRLAMEWWNAQRGSPRFMWVHLFTPHFPYDPGEPFASRHPIRPYYGEAERTDAQLGPLLAPFLDRSEPPAIVVLTSDHGESLGEHGEATHGLFGYEATLHVPLVFWAPGLVEVASDPRLARHIDLVPSILDLLGLDANLDLPGRSLFAQTEATEHDGTYFEALSASLNRGWAPLYGWIEGEQKAIDLPIPELYDLRADPREQNNGAEDDPVRLRSILSRIPESARAPVERGLEQAEVLDRLRSLGYVAAGGSSSTAGRFDRSQDPKALIGYDAMLQEALTLYHQGRTDAAIDLLRSLIREQPRMTVAYGHLSVLYADVGRVQDAVDLLRSAIDRGMDREEIRRKLALNLMRLDRPLQAEEVLRVHADSTDPETQSALGRVAAALGRTEEARQRFDQALKIDPTFPSALIDQGILLMQEGDVQGAEDHLARGLAADPHHAEGWNAIGVVRVRQGDQQAAIEAWRRAIEVDPRLADALYNLAVASARIGNPVESINMLDRYIPLVAGEERASAVAMRNELAARAPGR